MIGMQGFFGLLFFVRLGVLDLPFSSLSGEELTWAYFGHYSSGFLYFICCVQILGGMLLLFNRTRLMGVFVLIPVLVVIVTLNHFYDMEFAETATAIELLIQLLYLLLSERQRLWVFFVKERPSVSATSLRPLLKNLLRVFAVLIPLLLLWRYDSLHPKPVLTGKYAVSHWVVNGRERAVQPCADSMLTRVYLDLGNDCVFEFNSTSRRWIGDCFLSDGNKKISVVWHYPANVHDTLAGEIRQDGIGGGLRIDGLLGKDSVQISLVKVLSR